MKYNMIEKYNLEEKKIKDILEKIKNVKIAVYGDMCLDAYWLMEPSGSEVSVETGLKCDAVKVQSYTLGGAANIVANVSALKASRIYAIGVIGDDIFGREILRQFKEINIDITYLVVAGKNYSTVTYCKRYLDSKEIPRIDFGFYNKKTKKIEDSLIEGIKFALSSCDVLIFNQQIFGSLSNYFIEQINKLFERFDNKIVILDSRHYGNKIKNTYLKINALEAALLNNMKIKRYDEIDLEMIKKIGNNLYNLYKKPVFITRGERGIAVFDSKGFYEVHGIHLCKKLDRTGAGDTVISSLALCLAIRENPRVSAEFANFAASVTVQKLFQTGTASPEEIIQIAKNPDYIFQPELAEDYRRAKYVNNTEIELCYPLGLIPFGKIKYAVFDHDGTISTLREGWEKAMEQVMIRSILGDKYNSVSEKTFIEIQNYVKNYIDNSTGMLTLIQMEALVEMVKYFGYVPKNKILDSYGYKKIYNAEIMKFVNYRIAKIKAGELNCKDFIIKGAINFLNSLKNKGVRLYLVSGTDYEDTLNEAEILGYSKLFDGGIFGALQDISKFSKRMVIEKIITDFNIRGPELVIFGDGPVELREARRVGGIAVGVASDEKRNYGLDYIKRTRLIKGGAHIIIPDYTQFNKVLELLFV